MTFDEWWGAEYRDCRTLALLAWNAAVKQEREACALICDELHDQWEREGCNPSEAADAIRARSES